MIADLPVMPEGGFFWAYLGAALIAAVVIGIYVVHVRLERKRDAERENEPPTFI